MTDLTDRYLGAVRRYLPESIENKDDVIAELADDLQSRIDEGGDPVEVVRAMGHPRLVAMRYGPQHALIGAEWFPFYVFVLRWALSIAIAGELFAYTTIAVVTRNVDPLWDGLGTAWASLFYITGIVTVLFAIMERVRSGENPFARVLRDWDPNTLPEPDTSGLPDVSRLASAIEFLVNACVLLAFVGATSAQNLIVLWIPWQSIFAQLHVAFGTGWHTFVTSCIVASAAVAVQCLINFVRPDWTQMREGVRLVTNALLIVACASALRAGALVVPTAAMAQSDAHGFDLALRVTLIGAILAFAWAIVLNARALLRGRRSPLALNSVGLY